ncbi:hypothetical protein ACSFA8_25115 [Variovorax sp. RT4R15]|uniref:hypothetical protein n=1 Tax=Variovorax sp. RT4R15 TaxID=3443737 RepID=UPI003F4804E7
MLPEEHAALLKVLPAALLDAKTRLPAMLMDSLDEQVRRIQIPACKTVAKIPRVGLLTATAIVASMGSPFDEGDANLI